MRNKGMIIVDVLVSITLFLVTIFPLLELNRQLLRIYTRTSTLEREYKNFEVLKKQILRKDPGFIRSNYGTHRFEKGIKTPYEGIMEGVILPYPIDKDTEVVIDISGREISSEKDNYQYLVVNIMYTNNNKIFSSQSFVSRFGERDEKE